MRLLRAAALVAALALALPASAGMRPRYGGAVAVALPRATLDPDPAAADSVAALFLASLLHQPPLRRGADGRLVPVLLAEVPQSDDGGRSFVLRLRPGARFHDGRPIRAADLAATLRAMERGPWAALAIPLRAVEVRSATELVVQLHFPFPRWPEALASPGASVRPAGGGAGAGPFRIAGSTPSLLSLEPVADHPEGRPFLDGVALHLLADRRAAARFLADRRAQLGPAASPAAPLATWLVAAPGLEPGQAALAIDRADLVRWFVPGAAAPMETLLPPPHVAPPAPPPGAGGSGGRLELLFDPAVEGHRQVAERIQLRLHDRGIEVRLAPQEGAELRRRAAGGAYQLALLQLPLPAETAFAAASLLHASGRGQAARRLLASVGAAPASEAEGIVRGALAEARGIVPLYATTEAIVAAEGALQGGPDLPDAWLLPGTAP